MADEPIEEGSTGEIDGVPVVYQGGYWVRQPQGIPASTFQRVAEAVPTAIRVGSAFMSGSGGLPGAAAAGLGELAAQGAEVMLGQRSEFGGKQLAAQTALGAVPMGKLMAIRGLTRLPTAAREAVQTVGRATGGAIAGGVGAGVTALGEGETFQTALERARAAAPVGAGVGVVSPLVVKGVSKVLPAVGDLLQGTPQFLQRAIKTARETVNPQGVGSPSAKSGSAALLEQLGQTSPTPDLSMRRGMDIVRRAQQEILSPEEFAVGVARLKALGVPDAQIPYYLSNPAAAQGLINAGGVGRVPRP